jgi:hypothetical protein
MLQSNIRPIFTAYVPRTSRALDVRHGTRVVRPFDACKQQTHGYLRKQARNYGEVPGGPGTPPPHGLHLLKFYKEVKINVPRLRKLIWVINVTSIK